MNTLITILKLPFLILFLFLLAPVFALGAIINYEGLKQGVEEAIADIKKQNKNK